MTVLPFKPLPQTPAAVRWAVRAVLVYGAGRDQVVAAARKAGAGTLTEKQLIAICAEEWDCLHRRRNQP